MVIVSQDKDEIINFNNITSIVINDMWDDKPGQVIKARDVYGINRTLGYYKNTERAKEVLLNILDCYDKIVGAYGDEIYTNSRVYMMPEE